MRRLSTTPKSGILEINALRALMILWIFLTHFYEQYAEGGYFGNPNEHWPTLAERIGQMAPLDSGGLGGLLRNLFRYLGLSGDQGVQVFILISGFLLTLGLLRSGAAGPALGSYLKKRLLRIYPAWIICHLLLMGAWFFSDRGINPFAIHGWLSLAGIRFLPQLFYFASPAWWFIGTLLQLYLLLPFVYRISLARERSRVLPILILTAVLIRLAGLLYLEASHPAYLDAWSRGILFPARAPEFLAGVWLAGIYAKDARRFIRFISSPKGLSISFMIWVLGFLSSFTLGGMSLSFLLTGSGIFLFMWGLLSHLRTRAGGALQHFNRLGYEYYLVHHLVIVFLLGKTLTASWHTLTAFSVALILSLVLSWLLHVLLRSPPLRRTFQGLADLLFEQTRRLILILAGSYLLLLCAEKLTQLIQPCEVNGWGEKPALQMDAELGYTLIPDRVTRLRWQHYDYVVRANSLGFPGPEVLKDPPEGFGRILVTGDAFESAEGVNTEDSWPRLLEKELKGKAGASGHELINLSVTGWGPQHYRRVIQKYLPVYEPDLVIVGLFINDLQDVLISDEDFNKSIGFDRPMPFSAGTTLQLKHLARMLTTGSRTWAARICPRRPMPETYLGHPGLLLKSEREDLEKAAGIVGQQLQEIRDLCLDHGSALLAVLLPSSIQAGELQALRYLPRNADFGDTSIYDMDQPQHLLKAVCDSLDIFSVDLREAFAPLQGKGIYQPRNMHWTRQGHVVAAGWLAEQLVQSGLSGPETDADPLFQDKGHPEE